FLIAASTTSRISTISLHDALPISARNIMPPRIITRLIPVSPHYGNELRMCRFIKSRAAFDFGNIANTNNTPPYCSHNYCLFQTRSEEHTSELQSREDLVCRPLLEQ